MHCSRCGFINKPGSKFCQKCGNPLNNSNYGTNINTFSQSNYSNKPKSNNYLFILITTLVVIALIIGGTFVFLSYNHMDSLPLSLFSLDNEGTENTGDIEVNSATFYLDGNPNTGITTTIHVGKEHAGETMGVSTTFSRNGDNINNPTEYEQCVVDEDGDIVFTDYTPIPRYPDYCVIELTYGNSRYQFGCYMEKRKGTQTSVPEILS